MPKRIEPQFRSPSQEVTPIEQRPDDGPNTARKSRFSLGKITPQNYTRLLPLVWVPTLIINVAAGIVGAHLIMHIATSAPVAGANFVNAIGVLGGTAILWIYHLITIRLRLPRLQARYQAALRNHDRRWVKYLTKILTWRANARIGPPLFAVAGLLTLWFKVPVPVFFQATPTAAAPGVMEFNSLGMGCSIPYASDVKDFPVKGTVIGFVSVAEAMHLIRITEQLSGGVIDPAYIHNQRVRVLTVSGHGATVLTPDGMKVLLGETVTFVSGYREAGTACEYIPNMIVRTEN